MVWLWNQEGRKEYPGHIDLENCQKVDLTAEDKVMNDFAGISTITYYNQTLPLAFLKDRANQIIQKNPWLTSRLITTERGTLAAVYPYNSDNIDDYFKTATIPSLVNGTDFNQASGLLHGYQVKKGKDCIDKDEPLFKITIVSETMLVVSLSHTLADGYTFYKIYSMFEKEPTAMICKRVDAFTEKLSMFMGPDAKNFLMSPFTIFGLIYNVISAKSFPIVTREISKTAVESSKKDFQLPDDVEFISTNDLLTSWFFKITGCKYGMMALNMRNRVSVVGDDHAGNYEGTLIFRPNEDFSPLIIRKALKDMRVKDLPGYFDGIWGNNAVFSNWTSFHHDLILPGGIKPINHHPLEFEKVYLIQNVAILYKPTIDRVSLIFGDSNPVGVDMKTNLFL